MMKTKIVIPFVLIAAAILFIGNDCLYGSAGPENPWGINYSAPRGTVWTGTLVITGQIADVSGLPPGGLPDDAYPLVTEGLKDQIVKIEFFVRFENRKYPPEALTFSGLARDNEGYYLFYALGDYKDFGRIGEALNRFLREVVRPNLPPGGYPNIALTDLTESSNNVESQLTVDLATGRQLLQAGTPLYYIAKITIVTWYNTY